MYGSFRRSLGLAACGGLARDSSGKFIRGFFCNLGPCNSVWAELWALRLGIKLARSINCDGVIFEMDSLIVVNMVHSGSCHSQFLRPLLMEVLDELHRNDWVASVSHVFR